MIYNLAYIQLSRSLRRTPAGPATVRLKEVSGFMGVKVREVTPVILKLNLFAMNSRVFNLNGTAKNWNIVTEKWNFFLTVQSNVLYKQTFTASWSQSVTVYTGTGARLQNIKHFPIYCHVEHLHFCLKYFSLLKALLNCPLEVSKVSVVRLIESIVTVK